MLMFTVRSRGSALHAAERRPLLLLEFRTPCEKQWVIDPKWWTTGFWYNWQSSISICQGSWLLEVMKKACHAPPAAAGRLPAGFERFYLDLYV